eukprot:826308_1
MSIIILLLATVVCNATPLWQTEINISSLELMPNTKQIFQEWAVVYGKQYSSVDEESRHYITWLNNFHYIAEENSLDLSYKLRLNQFSDLTSDEFRIFVG